MDKVVTLRTIGHAFALDAVGAAIAHGATQQCPVAAAVMGAGGIGHDVAEFLVTDPAEAHENEAFFATWGVDGAFEAAGALTGDPLAPVTARRRVLMLQRKTMKPGGSLGVATGWIRRNALRKRGVEAISGVS